VSLLEGHCSYKSLVSQRLSNKRPHYTNLEISGRLSQQNAKQHDGSWSRRYHSGASFRDTGWKAEVEREDREEQEVEARCLSLRSPTLHTHPESKCLVHACSGTRFSEPLTGCPYRRPGVYTLSVTAKVTCDSSFPFCSISISALSHMP
jgi:hypothetical protein